jgi:hypothetical protein
MGNFERNLRQMCAKMDITCCLFGFNGVHAAVQVSAHALVVTGSLNGKSCMVDTSAPAWEHFHHVADIGLRGVAEEAPGANKDVGRVVDTAARAGLSRKVARPEPLICVEG